MKIVRGLAFIAGVGLISASAYALIVNAGGFSQAVTAFTTIALAFGVVVGSICVGTSPRGWAIAIVLGMLCGEAYSLVGTAERVVAAREAQQAPLIDALARHRAALAELSVAEATKPAPVSRDRLDAAEAAKKVAGDAAISKAAEIGCKANCAALLQAASDAAGREVVAARDEIATREASEISQISARIAAARRVVEQTPQPASASPFADRLGIAPWALDLFTACLLSLGLNGLAAVLIACSVHHSQPAASPSEGTPAPRKIARFMVDCVEAAPRSRVESAELYAAYCNWCTDHNVGALPAPQFADALVPVLNEVGIKRRTQGDDVFLVGVKLAS